jgi:hypothetical protein
VQIMKLLIMLFSIPSGHFIPLRLKYYRKHSVLKHVREILGWLNQRGLAYIGGTCSMHAENLI